MFYDILERKNAFLGYKNNKLKTQKIEIFPFFLLFFLGNISQENAFPHNQHKKLKKSKNWQFSKG